MNKDIDQVFWPTWLAVSQLRGGLEVDDGAAFYRRACQWVDSARNALRDLGTASTALNICSTPNVHYWMKAC